LSVPRTIICGLSSQGKRIITLGRACGILMSESDAVESVGLSARDAAVTSLHELRMAHSKVCLHVILSRLTDERSQLELDHSLPTEAAGGFRTARWNLVLLEAQSHAPAG